MVMPLNMPRQRLVAGRASRGIYHIRASPRIRGNGIWEKRIQANVNGNTLLELVV